MDELHTKDQTRAQVHEMTDHGQTFPNSDSQRPPLEKFILPIIIEPLSSIHQLTVVFLHGRGSNARKFHGPLLASPAPTTLSFREALPHARFVFPTAPLMRAAKYRRCVIHQWYEGTGDWEPESRGEMRPSIEHIHGILRAEIRLLGGDARRVILAGISQGCATALTSLLLWEGDSLGAVVGMCGFMPLNSSLMSILDEEGRPDHANGGTILGTEEEEDIFERDLEESFKTPLQRCIDELYEEAEISTSESKRPFSFLSTPVFMGHGMRDENVEYEHGKKAAMLLGKMGLLVDLHTYPELGHWYSPEMLGHIVSFLEKRTDIPNEKF